MLLTDEKMGKQFYEKSEVTGTEKITTLTYRCPTHHVVLFRVRADTPMPTGKIQIKCPEGDMVEVPNYPDSQKI